MEQPKRGGRSGSCRWQVFHGGGIPFKSHSCSSTAEPTLNECNPVLYVVIVILRCNDDIQFALSGMVALFVGDRGNECIFCGMESLLTNEVTFDEHFTQYNNALMNSPSINFFFFSLEFLHLEHLKCFPVCCPIKTRCF